MGDRMDLSTFFALFWGWLTLLMAGIYFIRPGVLEQVKTTIVKDRGFGLLYGIMTIILGIVSVILHTIWDGVWWHILITIFGYLALIKGILVVAAPELAYKTPYKTRLKSTRVALGI